MEKEKRITEIELRKKELNQEISDFNRDNVFTDNFRETDKLYVTENIKFYYDYFFKYLSKESDYKTEILAFNKKMKNKIITKTDYTEKPELEKYLNLYLELYNVGIEIDCLKVNQE